MSAELTRSAVYDRICDIMIEHGPDGHIDGADKLTDYTWNLLSMYTTASNHVPIAAELTEDDVRLLKRAIRLIVQAEPLLLAAEKHPLLRRILGR